jgi:hypothetical protein
MGYKKQGFADGQILTAAKLNHIEEGIEAAFNAMPPGVNDSEAGAAPWSGKKINEEITKLYSSGILPARVE